MADRTPRDVVNREQSFNARVFAFGSKKHMVSSTRIGYSACQQSLNRIDGVLCHGAIDGPLTSKDANEAALSINFDFIVADEFLRFAGITRSYQWAQTGNGAHNVIYIKAPCKISVHMAKQELSLFSRDDQLRIQRGLSFGRSYQQPTLPGNGKNDTPIIGLRYQ